LKISHKKRKDALAAFGGPLWMDRQKPFFPFVGPDFGFSMPAMLRA
jgi:hypothetical protein